MIFYFDKKTQKLVETRGGKPFSRLVGLSGCKIPIGLGFVEGYGVVVLPQAGQQIRLAVTSLSGELLAVLDDWTLDPETNLYKGFLNLYTEAMEEALEGVSRVFTQLQLIWETTGQGPFVSQNVEFVIDKSSANFTGDAPMSLPNAEEWLDIRAIRVDKLVDYTDEQKANILANLGDSVVGPPGPGNSLSIGTVTNGSSPAATITGDSPSQVLNLVLQKGLDGPPNELTVGTVTSGEEPQVTITGDSPNQTINFVLEKGETGPQGPQGETGNGFRPILDLAPPTKTDLGQIIPDEIAGIDCPIATSIIDLHEISETYPYRWMVTFSQDHGSPEETGMYFAFSNDIEGPWLRWDDPEVESEFDSIGITIPAARTNGSIPVADYPLENYGDFFYPIFWKGAWKIYAHAPGLSGQAQCSFFLDCPAGLNMFDISWGGWLRNVEIPSSRIHNGYTAPKVEAGTVSFFGLIQGTPASTCRYISKDGEAFAIDPESVTFGRQITAIGIENRTIHSNPTFYANGTYWFIRYISTLNQENGQNHPREIVLCHSTENGRLLGVPTFLTKKGGEGSISELGTNFAGAHVFDETTNSQYVLYSARDIDNKQKICALSLDWSNLDYDAEPIVEEIPDEYRASAAALQDDWTRAWPPFGDRVFVRSAKFEGSAPSGMTVSGTGTVAYNSLKGAVLTSGNNPDYTEFYWAGAEFYPNDHRSYLLTFKNLKGQTASGGIWEFGFKKKSDGLPVVRHRFHQAAVSLGGSILSYRNSSGVVTDKQTYQNRWLVNGSGYGGYDSGTDISIGVRYARHPQTGVVNYYVELYMGGEIHQVIPATDIMRNQTLIPYFRCEKAGIYFQEWELKVSTN